MMGERYGAMAVSFPAFFIPGIFRKGKKSFPLAQTFVAQWKKPCYNMLQRENRHDGRLICDCAGRGRSGRTM